jgi:hypothetical protein
MSKPELIKRGGWAFIAGALAFITILSGSDPIAIPGSEVSAILIAVGLSGLRAGYGEHIGDFGRYVLLLGASGPLLLPIVIAMGLFGILTETQITEGLWVLLFGGPAISLLGLTLFGLVALRSRPMPHFNWLPVLAGIWYPVFYFCLARYLFTHGGVYPGQYQSTFNVIYWIQILALCVFGAVVAGDRAQETVTA